VRGTPDQAFTERSMLMPDVLVYTIPHISRQSWRIATRGLFLLACPRNAMAACAYCRMRVCSCCLLKHIDSTMPLVVAAICHVRPGLHL